MKRVASFVPSRRPYLLAIALLAACHTERPIAREPVVVAARTNPTPPTVSPETDEELEALSKSATNPVSRADALFRLADLLSKREHAVTAPDLPGRLEKTIAVLRRIVRETPTYAKLSFVEYQLACELVDAARPAEALTVFRSLVCRDRYSYSATPDPRDPARDLVSSLPQDHPEAFWQRWSQTHADPRSVAKPSRAIRWPKRSFEIRIRRPARRRPATAMRHGSPPRSCFEWASFTSTSSCPTRGPTR